MCAAFLYILPASAISLDDKPINIQSSSVSEKRLDAIENSMNSMQKYLYNLGVAEGINNKSNEANKNVTDSLNLGEIHQHFKNLRSEIERIQYDIGLLSDKILNLSLDLEHKFSTSANVSNVGSEKDALNNIEAEIEKGSLEEDHSINTVQLPFDKDAEALFKRAYDKMESGDLKVALFSFENFTKTYTKNSLTSSAYFWIGEIYAKSSAYERAALSYLKSYKSGLDDGSGRLADSLYGLSNSLLRLGKRKESCIVMLRLKHQYYDKQETGISMKRRIDSLLSEAGC